MRVSKHISLEEATRSQTATRHKIDNTPSEKVLNNMQMVALACFEPIREWWGKPLTISSFYRSVELNDKIGGSATSQHCNGEAIDIDTGSKADNKKIFEWAKDNITFDQLINEYDYSWVHISYRSGKNRMQVLTIK